MSFFGKAKILINELEMEPGKFSRTVASNKITESDVWGLILKRIYSHTD